MTMYVVGNQHARRLGLLGCIVVLGSRLHFVVWTLLSVFDVFGMLCFLVYIFFYIYLYIYIEQTYVYILYFIYIFLCFLYVMFSFLCFLFLDNGSTTIMSVCVEAVMKKHGGCRRVGAWQ